ncbi:hypothetical protein IGB42_00681 [Andreprevotia sp. IGB-42]|uniref:DUF3108 domain-containing protein n=1 Tax=Andreprevotia sp. IGB-42 TaxID=2497473 RepID=UPI0013574262|nr:DUF3108 domain-containing protein [Andreprevotia sp. IGB-42]KAF0814627.1 hypothetical protein IGB42_00681 [Andreprevotia sp. IGB-42]
MTPRHRRWLIWALLASLFLHIVSIGGDTLLLLAGEWARNEPLKLRTPTRKLVSQDMDEAGELASLAGVKPAENITIQLGKPKPAARPAATPVPARNARKPAVTGKPALAAAGTASAVAAASSVTASQVLAQASAVAPQPSTVPQVAVATQAASKPAEPASAPASETPKALQFPRKVDITYTWGVIPARMSWEVDHGQYKLALRGALFGRTRTIASEGKVGRNGVVPMHFSDTKDGKLLNEATFDWDALAVQMNDNGKFASEVLKPGDQDLFSAAFQFALQGSKMKNFTFSMVSGRKFYRDIPFELRGESTLNLNGKLVDAILLRGQYEDRVFDFWLAPEWNNMPVRIHLTLGKENTFDIWASQITINGETVLASPAQQRPNGMHRP